MPGISRRDYLQTLSKPIFVDDDTFALPWIVNEERYPAFPLDDIYYVEAKTKGIVEEGGFEDLIKRGCFGTLLLPESNSWVPIAVDAQYIEESLEPLWSKALEAKEPWVRLVRNAPRDPSCQF